MYPTANKPFNTDPLLCRIALALGGVLPGAEAQLRMAPPSREILLRSRDHKGLPREAGVLIPLFYDAHRLSTLVITRAVYQGVHSGQVAFPGGKYEPGDGDIVATALRETEEEIGVHRSKIEVLGCLSEVYIPPSHFRVTPVVGFLRQPPEVVVNSHEVSSVSILALESIFDPGCRHSLSVDTPVGTFDTPAYCPGELVIWGATAMMISEFEQVWIAAGRG